MLIKDKRTLKAMSRRGHFEWPVTIGNEVHSDHSYVDNRLNTMTFEYNSTKYYIKFIDGCLFPFVFSLE